MNNLKTLIGKLNDTTRQAATRAANLCLGMGHYEVDLEHLFLALLEEPRSDVAAIARRCGIAMDALEADLRAELARFETGSSRTPVFSRHLPPLLEHAWLIASLAQRQPAQIRSAHLLLALLTEPELAQLAHRGSRLFARFPVDELKHHLEKFTHDSIETPAGVEGAIDGAAEDTAVADPVRQVTAKTPALDQFTTDLTQLARDGKIDPVVGREAEIRQAVDILMRLAARTIRS